jgi:hypothetical protein
MGSFRPEDLTVTGSGSAFVADVRFVEVLGSKQHVYFSIDATPAGAAAITGASPPRQASCTAAPLTARPG